MIPPLKVKCSKNQYNQDGSCEYFRWYPEKSEEFEQGKLCIKQNCIYFDGERK